MGRKHDSSGPNSSDESNQHHDPRFRSLSPGGEYGEYYDPRYNSQRYYPQYQPNDLVTNPVPHSFYAAPQPQLVSTHTGLASGSNFANNGNAYALGDGNLGPFFEYQCPKLAHFLAAAPAFVMSDQGIAQLRLSPRESISCVRWNNRFYITGTDIVRILTYRFQLFGRDVENRKKFEEGIFSDLRNLKTGIAASLENPRSELLEFLYAQHCVRTKKKQKVFFWDAVNHDKMFLETLERELKKDSAYKIAMNLFLNRPNVGGNPPPSSSATTLPVREPALSFIYDSNLTLEEQLFRLIPNAEHSLNFPHSMNSPSDLQISPQLRQSASIPYDRTQFEDVGEYREPGSSESDSPLYEDVTLLQPRRRMPSTRYSERRFSRSMGEPYSPVRRDVKPPVFPSTQPYPADNHMRRSRSGPHISAANLPTQRGYRSAPYHPSSECVEYVEDYAQSWTPDQQRQQEHLVPPQPSYARHSGSSRPSSTSSGPASSTRYNEAHLMPYGTSTGDSIPEDLASASSVSASSMYYSERGNAPLPPQYHDSGVSSRRVGYADDPEPINPDEGYLEDFGFKFNTFDAGVNEADRYYRPRERATEALIRPEPEPLDPGSQPDTHNFLSMQDYSNIGYDRSLSPDGFFGPPENNSEQVQQQQQQQQHDGQEDQSNPREEVEKGQPHQQGQQDRNPALVGSDQRQNSFCAPKYDSQDPC